jgi:hypothetical protein
MLGKWEREKRELGGTRLSSATSQLLEHGEGRGRGERAA